MESHRKNFTFFHLHSGVKVHYNFFFSSSIKGCWWDVILRPVAAWYFSHYVVLVSACCTDGWLVPGHRPLVVRQSGWSPGCCPSWSW
jgi:hypothetical protein